MTQRAHIPSVSGSYEATGDSTKSKEVGMRALQERILAGFEDIERFVEENCRLPEHGAGGDIFERLYAIRLDRILAQEDCLSLLETVDERGILAQAKARTSSLSAEDMNDSDLLEALGVEETDPEMTQLKHL